MTNTSAAHEASIQTSTPALRVWVKPEAKAAEVAQATLNGHTVPPVSDLITCAS